MSQEGWRRGGRPPPSATQNHGTAHTRLTLREPLVLYRWGGDSTFTGPKELLNRLGFTIKSRHRAPLGTPMGSPRGPLGSPKHPRDHPGISRDPPGTPQGPPKDPPRVPQAPPGCPRTPPVTPDAPPGTPKRPRLDSTRVLFRSRCSQQRRLPADSQFSSALHNSTPRTLGS